MVVTLENIDEVEDLHRTDFYKLITGQECEFRFGSTEIPPWKQNVRPDNMAQVMKAVQKFEKWQRENGCYTGHFDRIKKTYENKNYYSFQQEIGELLYVY